MLLEGVDGATAYLYAGLSRDADRRSGTRDGREEFDMAAKTLSAADGKVQAYDPIWAEIRREARAP